MVIGNCDLHSWLKFKHKIVCLDPVTKIFYNALLLILLGNS
mgnify:CR=1 FL=1